MKKNNYCKTCGSLLPTRYKTFCNIDCKQKHYSPLYVAPDGTQPLMVNGAFIKMVKKEMRKLTVEKRWLLRQRMKRWGTLTYTDQPVHPADIFVYKK